MKIAVFLKNHELCHFGDGADHKGQLAPYREKQWQSLHTQVCPGPWRGDPPPDGYVRWAR